MIYRLSLALRRIFCNQKENKFSRNVPDSRLFQCKLHVPSKLSSRKPVYRKRKRICLPMIFLVFVHAFTPFLVSFNALKSCYFQRHNVTIPQPNAHTKAHNKHKTEIFSVHCVCLLNVYLMFWTRSQWIWLVANFWLHIWFPVSHVSHVFFCTKWHPLVDSSANVHKNTNICCKLHAISFTGWCCLLFDSCVFSFFCFVHLPRFSPCQHVHSTRTLHIRVTCAHTNTEEREKKVRAKCSRKWTQTEYCSMSNLCICVFAMWILRVLCRAVCPVYTITPSCMSAPVGGRETLLWPINIQDSTIRKKLKQKVCINTRTRTTNTGQNATSTHQSWGELMNKYFSETSCNLEH